MAAHEGSDHAEQANPATSGRQRRGLDGLGLSHVRDSPWFSFGRPVGHTELPTPISRMGAEPVIERNRGRGQRCDEQLLALPSMGASGGCAVPKVN
jgi:hypothetical protein